MKNLHHLADESQNLGNYGFIKYNRGEHVDELQEKYPAAFLLLNQIARRARRTVSEITGLGVGEARIGDYKRCGIKTEQKYRTAKDILQKLGIITTRATNKGTVAKLIDTSIFDINAESNNVQDNEQITGKQRTDNEQITTNKKEKKEKKDRMKEVERPSIEDLRAYISEKGYNVNPEKFLSHYESNGWMVGKNKMKDWKAAVRTWHYSNFGNSGNGRCRSSLQVGAHPDQEAPTGPPSERDVLLRMHAHSEHELNSFERLLLDKEALRKYPGDIDKWKSNRDKARIEKENLERKLEALEAQEGESMTQVAEAEA